MLTILSLQRLQIQKIYSNKKTMPIYDFMIPIFVWWCIQVLKISIDFFEEKKFDRKFLRRAGWFPSVHSWISTSLTTLFLLKYWVASPEFAMALTFSFLFWYDAVNVRYEAGQHAKFINKISVELKNLFEHREAQLTLKERLWHTFVEAIGWIIISAGLTAILYYLLGL